MVLLLLFVLLLVNLVSVLNCITDINNWYFDMTTLVQMICHCLTYTHAAQVLKIAGLEGSIHNLEHFTLHWRGRRQDRWEREKYKLGKEEGGQEREGEEFVGMKYRDMDGRTEMAVHRPCQGQTHFTHYHQRGDGRHSPSWLKITSAGTCRHLAARNTTEREREREIKIIERDGEERINEQIWGSWEWKDDVLRCCHIALLEQSRRALYHFRLSGFTHADLRFHILWASKWGMGGVKKRTHEHTLPSNG